jgi:predicted alpha/beta hydrolase family esterase
MELDRLTLYARLWKTDLRNIGLAGHINIASGFGRWTGGYALFDNLREKAKAPRRYVPEHTSHTSLG